MNTNEEFLAIYDKYLRFSVSVAKQIVKDEGLAEDVAQDVFCYLYRVADDLDLSNERKIRALILTATHNKALDYLKKPHVKTEIFPSESEENEYEVSGENLEELVLRKEANVYRAKVLQKLRKKNPMNYEILIKVKYMDIPPDVVAQEYGITRNNVNNRILRTRIWLQKELLSIYNQNDKQNDRRHEKHHDKQKDKHHDKHHGKPNHKS
jgi:RNA polymerase sigma-70 factor (ECF subfamily)